jgi:psp operon transcriptional activator
MQIAPAQASTRTLPVDLKQAVRAVERAYLDDALAQARYNQRAAARLVGLSYHQFRACLRKHKLAAARAAEKD